jgi:membrane protein YdbS with pleckstrin-like domain
MLPLILQPSSRYLFKMRLIITVTALLFLLGSAAILWLISSDAAMYDNDQTLFYGGAILLNALWYVPAMLLTGPYYRSLSYEIQDDEVIVRAGIWTHSVKHVPYRTVTNLTVKRGILDRWFFGLGSLHIQTAGMSGTTGAEEVLAGLSDVNDVYGVVVRELQRFRGAMGPATTEIAGEGEAVSLKPSATAEAPAAAEVLNAILAEVRAIRESIEAG